MPDILRPLRMAEIRNGKVTNVIALCQPPSAFAAGCFTADHYAGIPSQLVDGCPPVSAGWNFLFEVGMTGPMTPVLVGPHGIVVSAGWAVTGMQFAAATDTQVEAWEAINDGPAVPA